MNDPLTAGARALLDAVEALFSAHDWERCARLLEPDAPDRVEVTIQAARAELVALRDAIRACRGEGR